MKPLKPLPEVRAYLKSLPDDPARESFVANCGTTLGHLRNVSHGSRPCSPSLAVKLERESGGVLTRRYLREEDWADLWPELAERAAA